MPLRLGLRGPSGSDAGLSCEQLWVETTYVLIGFMARLMNDGPCLGTHRVWAVRATFWLHLCQAKAFCLDNGIIIDLIVSPSLG